MSGCLFYHLYCTEHSAVFYFQDCYTVTVKGTRQFQERGPLFVSRSIVRRRGGGGGQEGGEGGGEVGGGDRREGWKEGG